LKYQLLKPQPHIVDWFTFQALETLDAISEYHHPRWGERISH